ncbi:MAG TPA: hypothetical protein V6C78_21935 [Crinalium sp.]|jgi:hypothetical protein
MDIHEQISRQRVKHIVSSYQLGGSETSQVEAYLDDLLSVYPSPLIELALIETLVDRWLTIPMVKGVDFLAQAQEKLKTWQSQPIVSTITPEQFQQITGLDPAPVFGSTELPPTQPIVHPS